MPLEVFDVMIPNMSAGVPPKRSYRCECINYVFVAGDIVSLEFLWPGPAPRGGQFFLIKPRRTGVFLGRPISAAGFKFAARQSIDIRESSDRRQKTDKTIKFDRRKNADRRLGDDVVLRFIIARRGNGSRDLVDMRPGEEAELIGPLGNCWPHADVPPGPIALISGGIGIAPLLAVVPELGKRPYDFYAGFKTGSYGLENLKPRALITSTEDGSQGVKGRIPDFFTPLGYSAVFACGPESMLKMIAKGCTSGGVPCFISIEKNMACGLGACLGCSIKTSLGNRRCCTDGPIFNAEEIYFEE